MFSVLLLRQNDVDLSSFYSLVSQPINPLYFVHLGRLWVDRVRGSSCRWLNLRSVFPEEVLISLLRLHLLPLRNGSLHLRQEISLPFSFQERCYHLYCDIGVDGETYYLPKLLAQQRVRDCVVTAWFLFHLRV